MISIIASIVGMVTGITALAVSLFNYLRDRPKIVINVKRGELKSADNLNDHQKAIIIMISNVGRRPVFITRVGLQLPRTEWEQPKCLLIADIVRGQKIGEGDSPMIFKVPQKIAKGFTANVNGSRAIAYDSTGRRYESQVLEESEYEGPVDESKRAIFIDSHGYIWVTPDDLNKLPMIMERK